MEKINKKHMNIKKLYEILISEDIVSSINENLDYLLEIIPEIKPMIGFEHKHPHHHPDKLERRKKYLEKTLRKF